MVREVETYQELENLLQNIPKEQFVVLDCFATWCGPCKAFSPFFDELSKEYGNVLFLKADVDKIDELTAEFKVRAMPTFIFFKNLTVIERIQGADQQKLVDYLTQISQ